MTEQQVSRQQTLEQMRAQYAWKCIGQAQQEPDTKKRKEYGQLARGAAADIQINGLGQTLAFWKAKNHNQLFEHVSKWLKQRFNFQEQDALKWITEKATTNQYRQATTETIAILIWIKRFAEAEILKGE